MLATTVPKIQERSPLKCNFARKLASLDPRVMVSNPDQAIKMFQEVLQRLIETRWKTSEEADTVLAEYRKLVSDAKRYHQDKFSSFTSLLSSCAHARNRYQMYLMERKAEQERNEKGHKRKALMEELTSAKKAKEDLEIGCKSTEIMTTKFDQL